MDDKEAAFRALVTGPIEPMPGLMALLDRADRAGVPMVAVTNAPRANAMLILSGIGITHRFKGIVIGAKLPHSKPHPLPYLDGLRLASGVASLSVAFEDSRAGVQSASAAGIPTVGIRSGLNHDDLTAAGARISAAAFDDPVLLAFLAERMGW